MRGRRLCLGETVSDVNTVDWGNDVLDVAHRTMKTMTANATMTLTTSPMTTTVCVKSAGVVEDDEEEGKDDEQDKIGQAEVGRICDDKSG